MPSRKITDLDPISSVTSEDLILIRELVAGYDRNMSVSQLAAKLTAVKNTGLTITGFIVSTTTLSVTSNGTNFVKSGDNGNLGASDSEFLSIEFIQCFLNGVLNTELEIDGMIGDQTKEAIRDYQSMRKVYPADGVWGMETSKSMTPEDKQTIDGCAKEFRTFLDKIIDFF